jgi:hypothetical protein
MAASAKTAYSCRLLLTHHAWPLVCADGTDVCCCIVQTAIEVYYAQLVVSATAPACCPAAWTLECMKDTAPHSACFGASHRSNSWHKGSGVCRLNLVY